MLISHGRHGDPGNESRQTHHRGRADQASKSRWTGGLEGCMADGRGRVEHFPRQNVLG
jgi:hypothetical protein